MAEEVRAWRLQWDGVNLRHARKHGLNPAIVKAVLANAPKLFDNAGHPERLTVIGPDRNGRFWTVSIELVRNNRRRPITGWPSTSKEIGLYEEGS